MPSRSGPTSSPTATRRSPPRCSTAPPARPSGAARRCASSTTTAGRGSFPLERNARYQFTIEAWRDPFATWLDEIAKKRAAGADAAPRDHRGRAHRRGGRRRAPTAPTQQALRALMRAARGAGGRLGGAARAPARRATTRRSIGRNAERAQPLSLRPRARGRSPTGSRRASRPGTSCSRARNPATRTGTAPSTTSSRRLPYVKDLGFDVLYFTPIHPIGAHQPQGPEQRAQGRSPATSAASTPSARDEGGHDAIHPELGTLRRFPPARGGGARARPRDRPRLRHPVLARPPLDQGASGMVRLAARRHRSSSPRTRRRSTRTSSTSTSTAPRCPRSGIELRDVVLFWVGARRAHLPRRQPAHQADPVLGMDDPRGERRAIPTCIFLAEAFTRPKMMRKLAKVGFQQSYTYFTWRNTKAELTDYIDRARTGEMGEYYRPNFFANTPDINPYYLQTSGPRRLHRARHPRGDAVERLRASTTASRSARARRSPARRSISIRRSTSSRPGTATGPATSASTSAKLNRIRRDNPALWDFRNTIFLNAWNDKILAYARMTPEKDNCVLVLVNLDPRNRQECTYEVPLWEFGLPDHGADRGRGPLATAAASRCTARRTASPSTPPSARSSSGA